MRVSISATRSSSSATMRYGSAIIRGSFFSEVSGLKLFCFM